MLLTCLAGVGWAAYTGKISLGKAAKNSYLTDVVRCGPLEINVTERGSLDSASNMVLVNKVEGSTTIIRIVEEGTHAEAGQILVELDSSKLRDDSTTNQINLEKAEAALIQATENLAIQETQNESDIAAAELKLKLAELDLEKYKNGEYQQEKNEFEGAIKLAEETLTRALDKFNFSKRMTKKGYVSQNELEGDRIAVTKAQIDQSVAKKKLEVLEKFTKERQMAEKQANAEEFAREVERVKRKATAALAQFKADLSACELTAKVERSKLQKLKNQIEACTLRAPQAGEVVYANNSNSSSSRSSSSEAPIAEGSQVRERQAIINLPDFSRMQVNARIHESKIGLIRSGLEANVRVDAVPGQIFHGVVSTVSSVPISGNWRTPDLKEYTVVIRLTDAVERLKQLKPGLTAEVEIKVDRIESALQVPVQTVVERGGKHFVFVVTEDGHEQREVAMGKTNDVFMQLIPEHSKVVEGDLVILNPRAYLPPESVSTEAAKESSEASANGPAKANANTKVESDKAEPAGGEKGKVGGEKGKKGGPSSKDAPSGSPYAEAAPGSAPGAARDPLAFFQRLDLDSDGKVTKAEMPERMQARFDALDANADGSIDKDEWQAGSASFSRPGGPPR